MLQLDQTFIESQQPEPIPAIFKLARAILIQSLHDVAKGQGANRDSALHWLYSNDTHYLFSFLNICMLLSLDPHKIRRVIKSDQLET